MNKVLEALRASGLREGHLLFYGLSFSEVHQIRFSSSPMKPTKKAALAGPCSRSLNISFFVIIW